MDFDIALADKYQIDVNSKELVARAETDAHLLATAKIKKEEALSVFVKNKLTEGCQLSLGFWVDCKPEDVNNWANALRLMEMVNGDTISIADYDNETRVITIEQLRTLCVEVGIYFQHVMTSKWMIRDQINSTQSLTALNSIVF